MAWLQHDLTYRRSLAYSAMSYVRLPLVRRDFLLNHVDESEIMRSDPGCRSLLREAKQYLSPGNRARTSVDRATPRPSTGFESIFLLLAPGSYDGNETFMGNASKYKPACDDDYSPGTYTELWAFHPRTATLRQLSSVPWPRRPKKGKAPAPAVGEGAGVTGYGNDLFVCGGLDSALMFRYHSELDTWSECSSMKRSRQHFAMTTVGDAIYVIGGVTADGTEPLASVDKYDISLNRWDTVGSLLHGVSFVFY